MENAYAADATAQGRAARADGCVIGREDRIDLTCTRDVEDFLYDGLNLKRLIRDKVERTKRELKRERSREERGRLAGVLSTCEAVVLPPEKNTTSSENLQRLARALGRPEPTWICEHRAARRIRSTSLSAIAGCAGVVSVPLVSSCRRRGNDETEVTAVLEAAGVPSLLSPQFDLRNANLRIHTICPNLISLAKKGFDPVDDGGDESGAGFGGEGDAEGMQLKVRSCIVAGQGRVFVSADVKFAEARALAHLSRDSKLARMIETEDDFFLALARQWDVERDLAKT